ncbi:putative membrane protein YeiH [Kocuria rhizophila]|uniref:trimeric intracellular cation channel family protein n=1 Tax=Kocuria rhizophila TaxID=72000 RepID=UPI00073D8BEA|nr:TRIC cation channel family protein [Kocuria rhizophila]MDV5998711.1 TRIC cation channel family protein [Kocuria rhizophila]
MELEAEAVFDVVDLLGVLTNGILGGVVARQLRMDLVGFVVLAIVSGLGGGMLRDTLLQQGFPVALTNPAYLTTALAGALVAYLMVFGSKWTFRALFVADCLSVGCWAATGTVKALGAGLAWPPAILLGVVTAVGGGMIRDIAVGRLPAIFGGNTLYATSALLASGLMALLSVLGHPTWGMAGAIVLSAVLSVSARRFGWRLPGPANLSPGALKRLRRRPTPGKHTRRG